VHLHHLGNPLLGDKVYAPKLVKGFARQMLHAWRLGFTHPRSGEWRAFERRYPLTSDEALATLR
jgi:23S rRNA pseudouridine1911/1915/1917 synthase